MVLGHVHGVGTCMQCCDMYVVLGHVCSVGTCM